MRTAVLALLLSGCSLLSTRHPAKIRYFTPEEVTPPGETTVAEPGDLEVRLAHIQAASYIQDRIAFRDAGTEIGYYGNLRWSEPPEDYLRRALARALFEQRGVREIVSGGGPSLEIDLEGFEELKAPRHAARVVVTWRLRADHHVVRQKTVVVERPLHGDADTDKVANAQAVAAGIAGALGEAVDHIVADVVHELGSQDAGAQTAQAE